MVHWVVVLGDYGRSPRMQYHTLSLSRLSDTQVHVIAYDGSEPLQQITQAPNIHLAYIPKPPAWSTKLPKIAGLGVKVLHQMITMLLMMLFHLPAPSTILMQNPPAIPSMALLWFVSLCRQAQLIIDWHNYGYTIMQLTYSSKHPLVRIAKAYEHFWGKRAHRHFCVTAAMQQHLATAFNVNAVVLHDRPPQQFRSISISEKHALFTKLAASIQEAAVGAALPSTSSSPSQTLLTQVSKSGEIQSRPDRPAVVVSSTSWTPDEDFSILLKSAQQYDQLASSSSSHPPLLIIITGRGPQRQMYLDKISSLPFSKVTFCSMWLEAEDYPLVLASADLGVCLHTSSSGLDLPMKVVDMFGCALPVCAVQYQCIDELVKTGQNGLLFGSAAQLAGQFMELFQGFPGSVTVGLQRLQQGVKAEQKMRWDENWTRAAAPVFRGGAERKAGVWGWVLAVVCLFLSVMVLLGQLWRS